MALKIEVHEAEEATKIRAKFLRALENEEYELLPGPSYVNSFLRTYAEYLGLDPREMSGRYRAQASSSDEESMAHASTRVGSGASRRWLLLVGVLLLIVLLLLVVGALARGAGAG